jgi:hypothetical protein
MPRNTTKINENELPRYLDPSKKAAVEMRDIIIKRASQSQGPQGKQGSRQFPPDH